MAEDWAFEDPLLSTPTLPLPALLRACRHFARLSQRELATRVGVSKSYVGDIESGDAGTPSYPLVLRIVEACGLRLVAIDPFTLPLFPRSYDDEKDRAGRRYPAHLDVRRVHADSDWWFSRTRPGQRKRPRFTASWERNIGRTRRRRNTPDESAVSQDRDHDG
jgi:transcriptional regulator with XRE-family HTH domain